MMGRNSSIRIPRTLSRFFGYYTAPEIRFHATPNSGTFRARRRLPGMEYTERDLEFARRNVVALERLIREHKAIPLLVTFDAELKPFAKEVLSHFEASLREARSRYSAIWSNLNSARYSHYSSHYSH
jgi:hypothetical protein